MSAVKLVSTKEMSREEWLQLRNRAIGSSDAPVAIGMSRYKSPLELWMEKTGRKIQEDISNKDAVSGGRLPWSPLWPTFTQKRRKKGAQGEFCAAVS
ncbi:YqaJ viral recombinase family protein [Acidithiobacillus ferrivorans]|uniref:Phage-type endonuclease n=1 Tax=Acidithiobacillus ferrivorans TaxID=160808 RepID=A0A060USV4_9PROT